MRLIVAFDLDGVVLDSRESIRMAYRRVGVEPPHDFDRREGEPWLAGIVGGALAEPIRRMKDVWYADAIRFGTVPYEAGMIAAQGLGEIPGTDVYLLTNAGWSAIDALRTRANGTFWPFSVAAGKMSSSMKGRFLANLAEAPTNKVVWIDDNRPWETIPECWHGGVENVHFPSVVDPRDSIRNRAQSLVTYIKERCL